MKWALTRGFVRATWHVLWWRWTHSLGTYTFDDDRTIQSIGCLTCHRTFYVRKTDAACKTDPVRQDGV